MQIDPNQITDAKHSLPPFSFRSADGRGNRHGTSYMLRLSGDKTWRRIMYKVLDADARTYYVHKAGEEHEITAECFVRIRKIIRHWRLKGI